MPPDTWCNPAQSGGNFCDPRHVFDVRDENAFLDVRLEHAMDEVFAFLRKVFRSGESHLPLRLVADHLLDVGIVVWHRSAYLQK